MNASVSLPGVTERPTSAYWHENTGAIARPASTLHTMPAAIERAAISGAVQTTSTTSSSW